MNFCLSTCLWKRNYQFIHNLIHLIIPNKQNIMTIAKNWKACMLPSREMVEREAFSIINKATHLELNSGLPAPLSSTLLAFISLQLTRTSWTLWTIAAELESIVFAVSRKLSASLRSPRSLIPMLCPLPWVALDMGGFKNSSRKRMHFGDSNRKSSWPCMNEIE